MARSGAGRGSVQRQWPFLAFAAPWTGAVVGGVIAWFVLHANRLPERVAYDWTPVGKVAVGGPAVPLLVSVLTTAVAVSALSTRAVIRRGADLSRRHVAAAIAVFGPGVLAGALWASLSNQLGPASAGRAHSPHFWLALVIVICGLTGAVGWLAVANPARPAASRHDAVAPSSWRGPAAGVPVSTFAAPAVISVLALLAAVVQAALLVPVAMLAAAAAVVLRGVSRRRPVVLADRDGLRLLLRNRERVRADIADITAVDVIHVRPLADFGGWGLRIGRGGRVGWVTRRGPALRVHRGFGGDVVITVADPEIPATVLATAMVEYLNDLDRTALRNVRLPELDMLEGGPAPASQELRSGGQFGASSAGHPEGQSAAS